MALLSLLALAVLPSLVYTQCPLSTPYQTPVVAAGYSLQLVANGLNRPRHIVFDTAGNLLVSGDPAGIVALTLSEAPNGCINVVQRRVIIPSGNLNLYHGLSISPSGTTIYASSSSTAYSWTYNPTTLTATNPRTLITGMLSTGHTTRTLYASPSHPSILLVSRGSQGNLDSGALTLSSGRCQIKAFNISSPTPQDFTTTGTLLGWGLRNSVGVAEDRNGGVWSVENSADQITRNGVDIHEDNPAEEMNYHGNLASALAGGGYVGPNYGYPSCLAVWEPEIPGGATLNTGSQFALTPSSTFTDATCAANYRPPRISFQAHTAPLDVKFHPGSGHAWVSFHGSWNREDAAGYKLGYVRFGSNGQPVEGAASRSAVVDVFWNEGVERCADGGCARPVGIAFGRGRVWVTSDATGEVFAITGPGV